MAKPILLERIARRKLHSSPPSHGNEGHEMDPNAASHLLLLGFVPFYPTSMFWRCHTGPRGTGWASRASFISLSGLQSDYLLLCLLDTRSLRDGDAVYNFLTPVGLPFLQFHLNLFLLTVICIVFFFPLVSYAAHHRNTP